MIAVKITDTGKAEKLLAKLPIELRTKALNKALRKAGNEVANRARSNLRKSRTFGSDDGGVPLAKTVRVVTRHYSSGVVMAMVGATYPDGAHSHLLEFGFVQHWVKLPSGVKVQRKVPRTIDAKPWLRPAADTSQAQQQKAITETLKKELKSLA